MKLDLDCIRAILFTLEDHLAYNTILTICEETLPSFPKLSPYPLDKVLYHIEKCDEAGFLNGVKYYSNSIDIAGLHYRGHEFLSNIRSSANWQKTKEIGLKIGAFGLDMAGKIAEGIATAYFKQQLGLL